MTPLFHPRWTCWVWCKIEISRCRAGEGEGTRAGDEKNGASVGFGENLVAAVGNESLSPLQGRVQAFWCGQRGLQGLMGSGLGKNGLVASSGGLEVLGVRQ